MCYIILLTFFPIFSYHYPVNYFPPTFIVNFLLIHTYIDERTIFIPLRSFYVIIVRKNVPYVFIFFYQRMVMIFQFRFSSTWRNHICKYATKEAPNNLTATTVDVSLGTSCGSNFAPCNVQKSSSLNLNKKSVYVDIRRVDVF